MTFENLLIERDDAVAIVTFNRPKVLNALNTQTLTELSAAIAGFKADAGVRAIVLTGAGEKSFVAGADINELAVQTPIEGKEHARRGQQIFDAIEQLGKPVIAAINGFALGGGCELAMACTMRIAADTARFGQPEINLGIIPGLRRQPAAAAPGRPRRRARDPADRRHDQRPARVRDWPRQSRRAGGGADGRGEEGCAHARVEGADRGALHHRSGASGPRRSARRRASSSRRRCLARSPRRTT